MELTVAELAEHPVLHMAPRPTFELVDRGDFVFEATAHRCAVHRLRLRDVEAALRWCREEALRRGTKRLEWWVGWTAEPAGLSERLLDAGLVPDDEEPTLTGMTCDSEPPAAPQVEVRRVETLEQQLEALAVDWEVWRLPDAEQRQREETERRRFDPSGPVQHFAAYEDGRAVGFGRAIDVDGGVALMGGAVLPEYRGHGVYRALVRARWDYAVARTTPLLVVQAGHLSAPVLDGLGFASHGRIHLFMDPRVASGHGDDRDEHRAG